MHCRRQVKRGGKAARLPPHFHYFEFYACRRAPFEGARLTLLAGCQVAAVADISAISARLSGDEAPVDVISSCARNVDIDVGRRRACCRAMALAGRWARRRHAAPARIFVACAHDARDWRAAALVEATRHVTRARRAAGAGDADDDNIFLSPPRASTFSVGFHAGSRWAAVSASSQAQRSSRQCRKGGTML